MRGPNLHLAHYPPRGERMHLPPGAPIPPVPAGVSAAQFYQTWSDNGSYPLVDGTCVGKWPANGQSGHPTVATATTSLTTRSPTCREAEAT